MSHRAGQLQAKEEAIQWHSWQSPPGMSIIFPLYIYPGSPDAWDRLLTQIALYPNVTWKIVINPANGPDGTTPSSEYAAVVPKLKVCPNVMLHGYVHTKEAAPTGTGLVPRQASDVANDIYDWTQWPANMRPTGLFVDECSNGFEENSDGSPRNDLPFYTELTGYAKGTNSVPDATFPTLPAGSFTNIILNPGGVLGDNSYFNIGDQVLMLENDWTACIGGNVGYPGSTGPADPMLQTMSRAINAVPVSQGKKSIMIYDVTFPNNDMTTDCCFAYWLGNLHAGGAIDSVFLSSNAVANPTAPPPANQNQYDYFAENLEKFVEFMAVGYRGPGYPYTGPVYG